LNPRRDSAFAPRSVSILPVLVVVAMMFSIRAKRPLSGAFARF
jgi:hypothetical protein